MKWRWEILAGWVSQHGWTFGAELGVFKGATFLHLLRRCPDLTLIGVDIWTPKPEKELERAAGGRSYKDHDLAGFERSVRDQAAQFGDRAIILKADTRAAAEEIQDGVLDFVFIDADHTASGVEGDILAWRRKIRRGGVLSGHDYNERDFPGVVSVVNRQCPGFELHDDHVWSVRC